MKLLALALVVLLSGCQSIFGPSGQASADQIKAAAADNKTIATCTAGVTMGGQVKVVVLMSDETRTNNTTASAKGNCDEVSLTTVVPDKPAPTPKPVPVPAPVSP